MNYHSFLFCKFFSFSEKNNWKKIYPFIFLFWKKQHYALVFFPFFMGAVLLNGKKFPKNYFECQKTKLSIPPTPVLLSETTPPVPFMCEIKNEVASALVSGSVTKIPQWCNRKEILRNMKLNVDESIGARGLLCSCLPAHISERKVIEAIDPVKMLMDFIPLMWDEVPFPKKQRFLLPATPAGIIRLSKNIRLTPQEKKWSLWGVQILWGNPLRLCLPIEVQR